MKYEPGCFLGDVEVAGELVAGYSFLMGGHHVHCHEPFLQRQFCLLEDGAHKAGKALETVGAFELVVAVAAYIDLLAAAERTCDVLAPTLLSDEIATTFFR